MPPGLPYLTLVSESRLSRYVSMWVPSAATAVPSPHACEMSRRACALTRSAIASFSSTIEKCLLATYDSSCSLTPGMCRAALYGPKSVPLTDVTIT